MRAAGGMDDEEPCDQQRAFHEVEEDGGGVETGQQGCQGRGGEGDSEEERSGVAMVEVVASFEFAAEAGARGIEYAVGGVKYPHGEGHGDGRGEWQADVAGARDEPGPERGYSGCV